MKKYLNSIFTFIMFKISPLPLVLVFCLLFAVVESGKSQCPSDHAQLRDWYNNNNGATWNVNWNTPPQSINDVNMTGWNGIEKDGNGCIIDFGYILGIINPIYNGTIPNFSLSKLKNLGITSSDFNGNIPNFDKLPNLENLRIYSNPNLKGNVPNFDKLPKLKTLEIQYTSIESIPNFDKLPNLEYLRIENNPNLKGNIPSFDKLPSLIEIILRFNQLSGSIPNFSLPELQYLSLRNNQLTGNVPNLDLPKLQYLHLQNNQLSGSIPNFNLPKLQYLTLENNQLTGNIPNFNLPNLQFLFLYQNQLTGNIPNLNLPNTLALALSNNKLSGNVPSFDKLPKLQYLYLRENQLSGCFPDNFKKKCAFSYDFRNNPKLPWQGDFQRFCNGEVQTGAACDDGDPDTTDDKIDVNCVCTGTKKTTPIDSTQKITTCIENSENKFPDLLTPNNDGANDLFDTGEILKSNGCSEIDLMDVRLSILNRWGERVYVGDVLNGWDGRKVNGERLPQGAYYYSIVFGKRKPLTGVINLLY